MSHKWEATAKGKLVILVVAACPFPYSRGTPIRIHRISEALASFGHSVHIATYHLGAEYSPTCTNLQIHRIADIPSYQKLDPGPSWQKLLWVDTMLVRKISEVLRAEPVDVIYAHHYEGLLTAALANRNSSLPVIYDAHTLLASELPFYRLGIPKRVKRAIGRMLDHAAPAAADGVVCVTEDIESALAPRARAPDRIITVPNGVELDVFSVRREQPSGNPGGEQKTVVYAGSLAEYQGIDLMLRSFAEVARTRPEVNFTIISDGDFDPYERLARRLNIGSRMTVVRAGLRELVSLLAQADVAVNPRVQCDGIPQKNLNYLAVGVPIVCFAGSAKQLKHGETAFVVPDGDVQRFSSAICRAIDDPVKAREIGERGRRYAEEHCSWDVAAHKVELFFHHLLSEFQQPEIAAKGG